MNDARQIDIVGAGLAGTLLATLLARMGWRVRVHERRSDPRVHGYAGGRSINLALAERGLHALRIAGVAEGVLSKAVMMRGRMVHSKDGSQQLQRYGRDDTEVIWSVSRAELNLVLLRAAEAAGAQLHFDRRLQAVDFNAGRAQFVADCDGSLHDTDFTALIGADGAGSALRAAMSQIMDLGERTEPLGHGYKELEIPPSDDGDFRVEANALHIWPRGDYMCIALPNDERTFTVTLFLPNLTGPDGEPPGFDCVRSGANAQALFARDFADALPLIPALREDFERNPVGVLSTLYLDRWHLDARAVLIGDAAHAMVPFHGQGMNCAFEDCIALAEHLEQCDDFGVAFAAFEAERLPNARAIQAMALENYLEMRASVDDSDFLLQRALEAALAQRHPERFVPRYAMVTFRRIPYTMARQRGAVQRELLQRFTHGHTSLDALDWQAIDEVVLSQMPTLDTPDAHRASAGMTNCN